MIFAKNFARNYEKYYLEHQTLGHLVICPSDPANQRIILKIVGFHERSLVWFWQKKVANRARSGFEGEKQHFLSNGIEIERLSFIHFLFNL